jgi:hypothetical protein
MIYLLSALKLRAVLRRMAADEWALLQKLAFASARSNTPIG